MTDNNHISESEQADFERDQRRYAFHDSFMSIHGYSPLGIYCQLTGKRIGHVDSDEFDALLDSLDLSDPEAASDDVAMRLLASMRPSMRWNKMRGETLADLADSDPVSTLAYLLNRLFAPLNSRKIGVDSLLGAYADRIKTYLLCAEWGRTDDTNTLTHMLLELDAKWSLDLEAAPFTAYDFMFDCATLEHRIGLLKPWYDLRVKAYDKKVKDDEMQVKWNRSGNVLAKPAFLKSWMRSKPISKTAANHAAKQADADFMAGLLNEILIDGISNHTPSSEPTPAFVPIRVTPIRFGVK